MNVVLAYVKTSSSQNIKKLIRRQEHHYMKIKDFEIKINDNSKETYMLKELQKQDKVACMKKQEITGCP